jgi:hypothetical protein
VQRLEISAFDVNKEAKGSQVTQSADKLLVSNTQKIEILKEKHMSALTDAKNQAESVD